jgi:5S rRNA maturation endonuclease (ribonuclease M5)
MQDAEAVKAAVDVRSVYERATGMSANGRINGGHYCMVRCPSPEHPDSGPSCNLDLDKKRFKCFSCPCRGDVFDLVAITQSDIASLPQAIEWIAERGLAGVAYDPSKSPYVSSVSSGGKETWLTEIHTKTYYDYRDEHGALRYQVVRYDGITDNGARGKRIFPRAWDPEKWTWIRVPGQDGKLRYTMDGVTRYPYRLPELLSAAQRRESVFLVEGEKCVEALARIGRCATTNSGGSNWEYPESWARYFDGVRGVIVIPDCDAPGRFAARIRRRFFIKYGIPTDLLELEASRTDKYDIADWLEERKHMPAWEVLRELRSLYATQRLALTDSREGAA